MKTIAKKASAIFLIAIAITAIFPSTTAEQITTQPTLSNMIGEIQVVRNILKDILIWILDNLIGDGGGGNQTG